MRSLSYEVSSASAVMLAAASFMVVAHAGNVMFFCLFLFSAWYWTQNETFRPVVHQRWAEDLLPFLILSGPFFAVLIGQIIRSDLRLDEFDAPSRLLLACLIYWVHGRFHTNSRYAMSTALGIGAIAGLIFLALSIDPDRTAYAGGRLSTRISWPNDLGAYSGILLTFVVWLILTSQTTRLTGKFPRTVFYVATLFAIIGGIYVFLGSQSRGPWVATAATLEILLSIVLAKRLGLMQGALLGGIIVISTTVLALNIQHWSSRVTSIMAEPVRWLKTKEESTSAGERLSMLVASSKLISMKPLTGYGDFGYLEAGCSDEFKPTPYYSRSLCAGSGPHNEVLARGLQSGTWGLLATLNLLLAPIVWFGFHLRKYWNSPNIYNPALLGLTFSINIAMVCLFMEPYSIKFTATFNALVLAVLFGEVVAAKRMSDQSGLKP
jgi:O-antigen ligase